MTERSAIGEIGMFVKTRIAFGLVVLGMWLVNLYFWFTNNGVLDLLNYTSVASVLMVLWMAWSLYYGFELIFIHVSRPRWTWAIGGALFAALLGLALYGGPLFFEQFPDKLFRLCSIITVVIILFDLLLSPHGPTPRKVPEEIFPKG